VSRSTYARVLVKYPIRKWFTSVAYTINELGNAAALTGTVSLRKNGEMPNSAGPVETSHVPFGHGCAVQPGSLPGKSVAPSQMDPSISRSNVLPLAGELLLMITVSVTWEVVGL